MLYYDTSVRLNYDATVAVVLILDLAALAIVHGLLNLGPRTATCVAEHTKSAVSSEITHGTGRLAANVTVKGTLGVHYILERMSISHLDHVKEY